MVGRRGTVEYGSDRGYALLHAGIGAGNVAVVDFLLDQGADAAATNRFGSTMHNAVMATAPPVVMVRLLEAGAPINAVTRGGLTPLDCAHIWEPSVIPFLRSQGATNAAVRIGLVPVRKEDRLFTFEGTDFGVQLPEGFSPWNRIQTPSDCMAWEVRNAANSSLSFCLGQAVKPTGTHATFKGFTAVASREENDWGSCWCARAAISFDSSRASHQKQDEADDGAHYDAVLSYRAYSRRDQRALEKALQTFFENKTTEAQPSGGE